MGHYSNQTRTLPTTTGGHYRQLHEYTVNNSKCIPSTTTWRHYQQSHKTNNYKRTPSTATQGHYQQPDKNAMTNYTNKLPTTPKVCYQQPHKNTINNYMRILFAWGRYQQPHKYIVTNYMWPLSSWHYQLSCDNTTIYHVMTLPTIGVLGIAKSLRYWLCVCMFVCV